MTIDAVMGIAEETMKITVMLMGPLLGVAMIVGLFVGVFQSITNINEQTLTFAPKIFAVAGVFLFCLPWMLQVLITFTKSLLLNYSYLK